MRDKKLVPQEFDLPEQPVPERSPAAAPALVAATKDKHPTSQVIATPGFALLDASGKIITANAQFGKSLQIDTSDTRLSLADKLRTRFTVNNGNFENVFNAEEGSVLEIRCSDSSHFLLHIAAIEHDQRIVLLENPTLGTSEAAQSHQLLIDPLTQLGNRRLLEQTLLNWQPTTTQPSLALIMMDLDRFKPVNDTLGHGVGDSLLKLVAKRTTRSARTDDIVVRLGGDEFVILHAIGEQPSGAENVSQRLVEMIGRPFLVNGHQINIGASIGIAVLGQGTEKVDDLLRHADLALYDAKAAGRGTHRFFTASLEKLALKRRELEISLRRALALKQFSLVYQPQVQLPQGNITGFEALLRWHHDKLGLIPPDQFISLAEETGEIMAIGEWVLKTACAEAMKWPEHLNVAVNVSPLQFESDRFADSICSALSYSGLPPSRLEIEITESVLINKPETALDHLCVIQDMGVSIAMDDFGTGYSSLSNLNDFPFSKIKIDQTFVRGKQTDKSKALVNAIISLGSSLGMETLAEGVETEDQFNQLSDGGCKSAQGYLISRPLAAQDVDDFISKSTASGTQN